jgi:2-polyprenyl-6-methoxyphenol hydroxylase-like FAD-dependent oxidoreductase
MVNSKSEVLINSTPEVLVVGAGPVGLFAALSLAKRGVRVQVVDTGVWTSKHSYALALHSQTLALLEKFGLLDGIMAAAYPVWRMGFYDANGRMAEVRLAGDHESRLCMVVIRQSGLEELLERKLGALGVNVLWGHEVADLVPEEDSVAITINNLDGEPRVRAGAPAECKLADAQILHVPYVIGTDGHDSFVRRALNIPFPEVGPAQHYGIFEFKSDFDLCHEARVVLTENSTDILWPLPVGYCRWSFQLPDCSDLTDKSMKEKLLSSGLRHFSAKRVKDRSLGTTSDDFSVLHPGKLSTLLAERASWFNGRIGDFSWRTVVMFERRLASSFGKGRVWLAGDAAHVTTPAGVHSMNLGLFEANELAEAIAHVLHATGSVGELDKYYNRWTAEWRRLEGIENGVKPLAGADPWIQKNASRLMTCLPAHGNVLTELAAQLKLDLALSKEGGFAPSD